MTRRLARGTVALGVQQLVSMLAMMFVHFIVARRLGPSSYGTLAVALAVLSMLSVTLFMGVPHTIAKFVAEDASRTRYLLRWGLMTQMGLALAVGLGLALASQPLATVLGEPRLATPLLFIALAAPLTGISYVHLHVLNGLRAFGRQAAGLGAMTLLKAAGILAFVLAGLGVSGAMQGVMYGAVLGVIVTAGLIGGLVTGTTRMDVGRLFLFAVQLTGTYVVVEIWYETDLVLLQILGGDNNEVGFFGAARTLTRGLEAAFLPLSITLYPLVSAWSARGLDDEWRRYVGRGVRLVMVTLSPLAAGAVYVSLPLMRVVFGEQFVGAAFIVAPLVVAGLISTMYELVDIGLRGSGRVGTSFRISAIVLAGHVLLNVILVPRWGVRGVLVTTLVTATVALILAARRVVPAGVLARQGTWIMRVITSSFVAFLPLRWITSDDGLMLLAAGGCLIGYAGLLHASGIIDLTRWRTVWTWLRVWDEDTRPEPPTE